VLEAFVVEYDKRRAENEFGTAPLAFAMTDGKTVVADMKREVTEYDLVEDDVPPEMRQSLLHAHVTTMKHSLVHNFV
jgi:hypothetical protein